MSDLISRADAIERIANDNVVGGMKRINEYLDSTEHNDYIDGISTAIATVDDLPSADAVKVAYICDGRKCDEDCSECFRTLDIEHARDFKLMGNTYYQQELADGERAEQTDNYQQDTQNDEVIDKNDTKLSTSHGRLIDADALLDEWLKQKDPTFKCGEMETFFENMCSKWIDILHDAPTVDIIGQCDGCIYERPHGEWQSDKDMKLMRCSECGTFFNKHTEFFDFEEFANFCPYCGADMRGDDND